jgi:hypothetical protein
MATGDMSGVGCKPEVTVIQLNDAFDPTATLASHDENALDTGFCPIKAFALATLSWYADGHALR